MNFPADKQAEKIAKFLKLLEITASQISLDMRICLPYTNIKGVSFCWGIFG